MMKGKLGVINEIVKLFFEMNEYEKVVVVYEKVNNGQFFVVYQQQVDKYCSQIIQN